MYASITEKSMTQDPVLLFATLAVAEAKSAPSSGSFVIEVTGGHCAPERPSSRHTIQSLSKHVAETATMMLSFGAFSVANTHPIRAFRMSLSNGTLTYSEHASRRARYRPIAKHAISTIALGNGLHASRSVHRIVAYNSLASRRISSSVDSSPEMLL